MDKEGIEEIWLFIERGYGFYNEYIGGDRTLLWVASYKGEEIGRGYSRTQYNYDEIVPIWKQHRRDNMLKSILSEVEKNGTNIIR